MENYKKKLFKEYDVLKKTKTTKNELLDFPVAIIPARIGSKRLKEKNIKKINNKPLVYYAISAAKKSKFIKKVFVTSESQRVLKIAKKYGAEVIARPEFLSEPHVYKMDAIIHAVNEIKNLENPLLLLVYRQILQKLHLKILMKQLII